MQMRPISDSWYPALAAVATGPTAARTQLRGVPRVDRVAVGDAPAGRVAGCRVAGEEVQGMALVRGLPLPVGAREDGEVGSGEIAGDDRRVGFTARAKPGSEAVVTAGAKQISDDTGAGACTLVGQRLRRTVPNRSTGCCR